MIRYYKYQNHSNLEKAKNKWFLRVKNGEQYGIDELAQHIASHSSSYTEGELSGMIKDIVNCVVELVLDGKTVRLPNLAIFSLGVKCVGANEPEEATVANIRSIHINARGTGKFSANQLKERVRFKEMDAYSL